MDIEFNEEEIAKRQRERKAEKLGVKLHASQKEKPENDDSPLEHFKTQQLHALINARLNVWLPGPAGAGKSKAIELVARALNLPFYCPPIGRETTSSQLMGYFNAAGNYVRTPLREAVEKGGVVHFEEFDFASPAVGTSTNSILANDFVGFPDQVIEKHKDFVLLASANTYGSGANATYIGSQGLNAATLNRFVYLDWPYDEKLERRLTPKTLQWTAHVQTIRAKVQKLGLKVVISPRASINGGKMLQTNAFSFEEVEMSTMFSGLDKLTIEKIRNTSLA